MSVEISESFRWLEQVQPSERLLVGDKAYHLSVLLQQGFPVIPGLVVTAQVMRRFLETLAWLEPMFSDLPNSSLHLNVDNPYQLQAIARQMRHAIQATALPADWIAQLFTKVQQWETPALIVRPSLALNLRGDPGLSQRVRGLLASQACWATETELARALQAVWAELFHARSLFYWERSHIPLQHLYLGVLIQPLWPADIAGDMQVNDTVTQIQAVQGYGHGLVRGDVIPDQYILAQPDAKATAEIHPKTYAYRMHPPNLSGTEPSPLHLEVVTTPSVQPTLNPDQLQQLKQLSHRAKQSLGYDLDMEWCHSSPPQQAPRFCITQVNLYQGRTLVSQEDPTQLEESVLIALRKETLQHWVGVGAAPGRVLKPVLVMRGLPPQPEMMQDHILVVTTINPEWLPAMQRAAGLITEQGGVTSHGAILARELGIPAVVGATGIMQDLRSGDMVLLDGDRGTIARLAATAAQFLSTPFPPTAAKPQSTTTQLMVSISQPERLGAIARLPLDGLGLLRSEHLIVRLLKGQPLEQAMAEPSEFIQRLAQEIRPFLEAFALRPVFYRSADLRSHDYPSLQSTPSSQQNSLLGWHGPLSYLQNPTLFQAELQALQQLQEEGYVNVRLMLPFVRTVEEFRSCSTWIRDAKLFQNPAFQVWIMAEVPAVLFQMPEFVQAGVQGISIGTNDLTQLLLAIDRDQADLADIYTATHPSAMRAMHYLIDAAKSLGIPCMVCGEAPAQYPEIIQDLVQWGITGLSVSPDAVERVGRAIAQAEQTLTDHVREPNKNV